MKTASDFFLVVVTAPNLRTARQLALAALRARLVACANLLPGVESRYWWRGKLERSGEVLLLLKTPRQALRELERLILERHPYQTPECIALRLDRGNAAFLAWWQQACRPPARRAARRSR